MDKVFYVVSHTHWDREWYLPLEQFRMRLVELIDRLMLIIEQYPDYRFHLDAQTVVLEDYLEIRPHKRERLESYIRSGNIIVGPWYLQNDFYLTSGEATIRNLLEGMRLSEAFGGSSREGYAPDQFGNISQLPQILRGFGIDNFIFGRGLREFVKNENGGWELRETPAEFIWRGADGSEVLAIHLKNWYNNAQRFSADPEKSRKMVRIQEQHLSAAVSTPYILLMNGVDHLEAQDDLFPVLERLRSHGDDPLDIRQAGLSDYVRDVREYVESNDIRLWRHSGELRSGYDYDILQGTLSSRIYLKQSNDSCQRMLEQRLEPLYSMLELYGLKDIFPRDYMRFAWKSLMKNHPHDSICGCSRDEVHRQMESRFEQLGNMTSELLRRGLEEAVYHSAAIDGGDGYAVLLVNSTGCGNQGLVEAELLFPLEDEVDGFSIYDSEGNSVPYGVVSSEIRDYDVLSPLNLPGVKKVEACRVYLRAGDIPAFAVQALRVEKNSGGRTGALKLIEDHTVEIENGRYKITVGQNGRVALLDKAAGRTVPDLLYLEDTADRGDAYIYHPGEDGAIVSGAFEAAVTVLEKNSFRQSLRISWDMELPSEYRFAERARGSDPVRVAADVTLTLNGGSDVVECSCTVDNQAKDHRVRLVFAPDIENARCFADIPFDIIERSPEPVRDTVSDTHPSSSFALLQNGRAGLAVFHMGTPEFELLDSSRLAFTLVRSTGVINRDRITLKEGGGAQWRVPENQCLRKIHADFGITLFNGDYVDEEIPQAAVKYRNPILAYAVPKDRKKFSGGRPAVQDTSLEEYYYLPDRYAGIALPDRRRAVSVSGGHVLISALKQSENPGGTVVRLWSYGHAAEEVTVAAPGQIYQTNLAETSRDFIGSGAAGIKIQPKEIVTLLITPDDR